MPVAKTYYLQGYSIFKVHVTYIVLVRMICVYLVILYIMKTFILELEPVGLVYLLYINLSVNAICVAHVLFHVYVCLGIILSL